MTERRNSPAIPADTSPAAWRAQMEIIRGLSQQERSQMFTELNRRGVEMHEASVRRRHPEYSDHEVFLAMVKGRYGEELAAEVWPESVGVQP